MSGDLSDGRDSDIHARIPIRTVLLIGAGLVSVGMAFGPALYQKTEEKSLSVCYENAASAESVAASAIESAKDANVRITALEHRFVQFEADDEARAPLRYSQADAERKDRENERAHATLAAEIERLERRVSRLEHEVEVLESRKVGG